MRKFATQLEGCFVLEPRVFGDPRGWFMESYSQRTFEQLELDYDFVQDNHSYSAHQGVIRGIHLQNYPYAQAKLVRCTRGKILDVAVDLRPDSPTYKQWFAVELGAENQKMLLIPRGFGHAFLTLEEHCEVLYKADSLYDTASDRSIRYDDPEIGIEWDVTLPLLSDKDLNAPLLRDADIQWEETK